MKLRVAFEVDDEVRKAIARQNDGRRYDWRRKATRSEIEGAIRDGAEHSLVDAAAQYRIHRGAEIRSLEAAIDPDGSRKGQRSLHRAIERLRS